MHNQSFHYYYHYYYDCDDGDDDDDDGDDCDDGDEDDGGVGGDDGDEDDDVDDDDDDYYYFYYLLLLLLLLLNYVNVSMGACGFIEKDSKSLFDLRRLKLPENEILFLTRRITNTCIRASYYIFCRRSKEWTSPELLTF